MAAAYELRETLGVGHQISVVGLGDRFSFIPSNPWLAVGGAFVALPQIPPRNVTWTKVGKWVHVAKVGFEKYFLYKMRHGTSEPIYEKYILGLLGIERLKNGRH